MPKKTFPALFRGLCASSVTPFDDRGGLALKRIKPHIDWLIQEGVNAISPLGSSGGFAGLEVDGRKQVLRTIAGDCANVCCFDLRK